MKSSVDDSIAEKVAYKSSLWHEVCHMNYNVIYNNLGMIDLLIYLM